MADSSSSRQRSRSRSPARRGHGGGGFRWKKKPSSRYDDERDDSSNRRYRQRSRSPRRDYSRTDRYDPRRPPRRDRDRDDNNTNSAPNKPSSSRTTDNVDKDDKRSEKKDEPPKKKIVQSEPLLIVHINNRLGSKTSVPCLGSDKIHQLKALVAAQIGQPPSSIVLKRQGERPFKDQLTLDDYGISSGVQLDLEIDTGD